MIPRSELQEGWYICEGRCPPVCYWNGQLFHTLRPKFGTLHHGEELHWEDDPKYGTVKPVMLLLIGLEHLYGLGLITREEE